MSGNEIDLHGLLPSEALAAFITAYNRLVGQSHSRAMRVIHGYGSSGSGGVIRRQLRAFLEQHEDRLTWIPGENIDGNPGYTIVNPRTSLPTNSDQLASSILKYCGVQRTEGKIAGEFRRYTAKEVKEAIRSLVNHGKLGERMKAGHRLFINSSNSLPAAGKPSGNGQKSKR